MYEVVKIFVFLIAFAITISGVPLLCQEYSPVIFGLPTSQPIATDCEMLHVTSSANGITAAPQTLTQNRSHPSRPSLHLTSPNLDLPEAQIQWVHALCQRDFSFSQKAIPWLNYMASS